MLTNVWVWLFVIGVVMCLSWCVQYSRFVEKNPFGYYPIPLYGMVGVMLVIFMSGAILAFPYHTNFQPVPFTYNVYEDYAVVSTRYGQCNVMRNSQIKALAHLDHVYVMRTYTSLGVMIFEDVTLDANPNCAVYPN